MENIFSVEKDNSDATKEEESCSPTLSLVPLRAPSPVLLTMPSVYTDFTGFFRTSDIISSVVIKLGDEPDPNPYILKTWKEMWGNSENDPPIYISSAAQFAIEDSMYAKKHITKVGDFSVNTDGLTTEEVELISRYVVDNYFKLQEDVQTLINKVIDEKKSDWKLIKIEDGGCVETDPPAEYINLTYETGTQNVKVEILDPSDHSTENL
jgi:hypothetical protein